jgi:hypothetical protein
MVRSLVVAVLVSASLAGATAPAGAQTPPHPAPAKKAVPPTRKAAKPVAPTSAPVEAPPVPVVVAPPSDVKVVTAYTLGAQVSTSTTLIRGARQRVEFPGVVAIDQCDLERTVMLSPGARKYRVQPYVKGETAPPQATPEIAAPFGGVMGMPPDAGQPRRGGVVTMATTITDTLERQPMFGLEARRIKTVVTRTASKDACDPASSRTEIDAWYVDLPKTGGACSARSAAEPPPAPHEACQDRLESRVAGDATLGFPVKTVTTVVTGEGDKQETSSTSAEVTALEITRLDAALFDVPADYSEAKSLLELTPSVAAGGTLADALFGSTADGTSQAAPKKPGITRIGVLEPVDRSTRGTMQTRALRQELVTRLTKGQTEALPLNGSSPEAIAADMSRLQCDYVLLAEVTEVKTSKPGKMGGLMKMASGGGPPKDKHEVKATYRMFPADGSATVKASGEVKADNGGGFGLGSALRVAAFAGQMTMGFGQMRMMRGFGGMGGLGMGMGMMNPMYGLASSGGMGAMGGGFFDPRSMAMTSMAMGYTGGVGGMDIPGMPSFDPADQEVFQVATQAAGDIAKSVTDRLTTGK